MYFKGIAFQCSGLVVTLGRFNSSLYYFIFYYLYKATVVLVKYIIHVLHKTSLLLGKVTHSLSCTRKLKKHQCFFLDACLIIQVRTSQKDALAHLNVAFSMVTIMKLTARAIVSQCTRFGLYTDVL